MNYIKKLQAQLAEKEKQIEMAKNEVNNFISHLHSDKFAGHDSQGNRKDWISTADVLNRLMEIRRIL